MRIFGVLVVLIILLVVGALIAPQFIDWNQYKGQIVSKIDSSTGFQAEINGDLDLAVLPMPRVVVNGLSLTNPSENSPLLSLDHADVYLDIMPLLSGNISLKSITLNKPQITLRVQKDGTKNWMTDKLSPEEGAENASSGSSSDVAIGSLTIKDGLLSYEDLQKNTKQEFKEINATFSMQSLQGPFDVNGTVDALGYPLKINAKTEKMNDANQTIVANVKAGLEGAEVNFSGVIGYGETPDVQGETGITIANLKSFLENITGTEQASYFDLPVKTSGIITASTESVDYTNLVANIADKTVSGQLSVENIAKYPNNPLSINLNLAGDQNISIASQISLAQQSIQINRSKYTYKSSDIQGSVTYKFPSSNQKASLDLSLSSPKANVDELLELINTKNTTSSKQTSLKETAQSFSLPFDTTFRVVADSVIYNKVGLESLDVTGSMKGNKLNLEKLNVRKYAGAEFDLKGTVENVPMLSGINLSGSMKTDDVENTLTALGQAKLLQDAPTKIGSVDMSVALGGSIDSLAFDTNVKALEGTLSAKGTATSIETSPEFKDMTLGIKHPNLANLMQKLSPDSEKNATLAKSVDLSSKVDLKDNVYTLNNLKGSFGPISMDGNIVADMGSKKPSITGQITTGKLPLDTFMDSSSGGTGTGTGGAGKWSNEPIDTAWMESANVDLKMASSEITYGGWKFEKPSFGLTLKDSVLTVDKWSAGLFGGSSNLDLTMSGKQGINLKTNLSLDNVGLQSLVVALAGAPVVQSKGVTDLKTNLTASGASMASLISSLNGDGTVNGTDITIRGLNVAEISRAMSSASSLGSQAKALFSTGIKGGTSEFDTLQGEFTISKGIVTFKKLDLSGKEAVVITTGDVSLPAWTLDMKSSVQLIVAEGEEVPPPFEISYRGSLSNPGSSFAQNAIEQYLNKKISAKANKLIQDKLGDKLDGELGGVIGGLLGVKPQQQQQQQVAPTTNEEPAAGDEGAANDNTAPSPYTPESAKVQEQQEAQQQQQQQQEQQREASPEEVLEGVLKQLIR